MVTGGTKGIGKAIADHFEAAGDQVIGVGRATCDVTDEEQANQLFQTVGCRRSSTTRPGRGCAARQDDARHLAPHLEVNATGAFLCTRAVLADMIERGNGRIVTVASTAGLRGARYTAPYTARSTLRSA